MGCSSSSPGPNVEILQPPARINIPRRTELFNIIENRITCADNHQMFIYNIENGLAVLQDRVETCNSGDDNLALFQRELADFKEIWNL